MFCGKCVDKIFLIALLFFACPHFSFIQYADPNYAGGGYDEYFGDGAEGSLDCHSPDTNWMLIGVYKQEFYQYIEQISKHLW
jgi:hypothetical protein